MNIKVRKLTDVSLLREANGFTTNKESKMSLLTAYKTKHSPCRTQLFWITFEDIPLFVASQLVRSHVGIQCFQLSKRTDRGGEDFNDICRNIAFRIRTEHINHMDTPAGQLADNYGDYANEVEELPERFDRYAPTNLAMLINAEAIMSMSAKRLCKKASNETCEIWQKTLELIEEVDPDLVKFCKKPCVLQGYCREGKPCGYMASDAYIFERKTFKNLFKPKVLWI